MPTVTPGSRAPFSIAGSFNGRRKSVDTQAASLTRSYTFERQALPLVIEPAVAGLDLIEWAGDRRAYLDDQISRCGAVLLRNFAVDSVDRFQQCVSAICGPLLDYVERSSPRTRVSGMVFTSTDHPADQSVFLHNEQSYNVTFPLRIAFFCRVPASVGGRTPIADTRNVLKRLSTDTSARFLERRFSLVRNYGGGCGLSWQAAFQTDDPAVVNEHCRRNDIAVAWRGSELRTTQIRPVIARHPTTGALAWFNHATFFHLSTLDPAVRADLAAHFPEAELPNQTYYGDGSPIEDRVMEELRRAYAAEQVSFEWQAGDILLLDNMSVAHAREPFSGPRQVAVAMAQPRQWRDVVVRHGEDLAGAAPQEQMS